MGRFIQLTLKLEMDLKPFFRTGAFFLIHDLCTRKRPPKSLKTESKFLVR